MEYYNYEILEYVWVVKEEKEADYSWNTVFYLSTDWWTVLFAQSLNDSQRVIQSIFSVKLGNLLIDKDMNLKLADFGLTTKL